MHNLCSLKGVAAALVGGALTVAMSGCGMLSIESWVVIDGAKSSGSVSVNGGAAQALTDLQGGFLGLPVKFDLNLTVTNQETLPPLDASAASCAAQFAANGLPQGLFYGINSKSSYLIASNGDKPQPPQVIALSDVGAVPGNKLQITRLGTFANSLLLSNGNLTKVSGLFSSSNTVLGTNMQFRVPGAIQSSAPMLFTPIIFRGFFLQPTDIPQDFLIDPSITVVVPNGAKFLVVAPFSPDLVWGNDTGFDLGVALQVVK